MLDNFFEIAERGRALLADDIRGEIDEIVEPISLQRAAGPRSKPAAI
jgi:hypothetical protein